MSSRWMSSSLSFAVAMFSVSVGAFLILAGVSFVEAEATGGRVDIVSHSSFIGYLKLEAANQTFEGDFYHVVALIENTGTVNIEHVNMIPTFYGADGRVIDIGSEMLDLWCPRTFVNNTWQPDNLIAPGQRLPVKVTVLDEEVGRKIARYDLSIDFDETSREPYRQVQVLGTSLYLDEWHAYLTGEIKNSGKGNIYYDLFFAFYDETGRIVDGGYYVGPIRILVPEQKSPFEIQLWPLHDLTPPMNIESYELFPQCVETAVMPYREFEIPSNRSYVGEFYPIVEKGMIVEGEVKNVGSRDATGVVVAATFYDVEGRVVGVSHDGWMTNRALKAGETDSFKLVPMTDEVWSTKVANYVLQVTCHEQILPSSISCKVSKPEVVLGEQVEVLGSTSPRRGGVVVTLRYIKPDGSTLARSVTTSDDGSYFDTCTPDMLGQWGVEASWRGDEYYFGATSQSLLFMVKGPTSISYSISSQKIAINETITLSGTLSPRHTNAAVTLTVVEPDGSTITTKVETMPDGSFSLVLNPQAAGVWGITASWGGDEDHAGTTGPLVTFAVEERKEVEKGFVVRQVPSPEVVSASIVVGAGVAVGVPALMGASGLARGIDSATSRLGVPGWLRDFVKLYAEETFKVLTEEEAEAAERRGLITKKELFSLTVSGIVLLIVFSYVEVGGLPNFLNTPLVLRVTPLILGSVVLVFIAIESFTVIAARVLKVWSEFKISIYGLTALLVSGILFLVPFAYPGRVCYRGKLSSRKVVTIALLKIICFFIPTLPFYIFHTIGLATIADAGLLAATMLACYSAFPIKPLEGEAVFRYNKALWLVVFAVSFTLFLNAVFNMLPRIVYLLSGVASVTLFASLLSVSRRFEESPGLVSPPPI